jgi:hypothetical protein
MHTEISVILNFERGEVNNVVSWCPHAHNSYCFLNNGKVEVVKNWKAWSNDLPMVITDLEQARKVHTILVDNGLRDDFDVHADYAFRYKNRVTKMVAGDTYAFYWNLWEDDYQGKIEIRANNGDDSYYTKVFNNKEDRAAFWKVIEENAPFCYLSRELLRFVPD